MGRVHSERAAAGRDQCGGNVWAPVRCMMLSYGLFNERAPPPLGSPHSDLALLGSAS